MLEMSALETVNVPRPEPRASNMMSRAKLGLSSPVALEERLSRLLGIKSYSGAGRGAKPCLDGSRSSSI